MGMSQGSIVLKSVMCLKLLLRERTSGHYFEFSPLCTKEKTSELEGTGLRVLRSSNNCINGWGVISIVSRLVHCLT